MNLDTFLSGFRLEATLMNFQNSFCLFLGQSLFDLGDKYF